MYIASHCSPLEVPSSSAYPDLHPAPERQYLAPHPSSGFFPPMFLCRREYRPPSQTQFRLLALTVPMPSPPNLLTHSAPEAFGTLVFIAKLSEMRRARILKRWRNPHWNRCITRLSENHRTPRIISTIIISEE